MRWLMEKMLMIAALMVALLTGCEQTPRAASTAAQPSAAQPGVATNAPAAAIVDTPEGVMQRYEDAKNRNDFAAQATCLTPETLQAFAGMQISNAAAVAKSTGRAPKELEQRGMTAAKLVELFEVPDTERPAAILAAAATMQDLTGLYAEVMARERLKTPLAPPPPAKINGVSIQGDRATAQVEANINGQPFHATVELRRLPDGWKVDDSRHYFIY